LALSRVRFLTIELPIRRKLLAECANALDCPLARAVVINREGAITEDANLKAFVEN
jgi:hypothetical protein